MTIRRIHSRVVVPAAAAVLCIGLLGACADGDSAGPETGTSLEDVQESVPPVIGANSLVGRTVTVSGEVEDVLSDRSFTMGGDETEELLVVHGPGLSVREDQVVRVTGVVRAGFNLADVEEDLDVDFDDTFFDDPIFDPFELEPFLVTKSVQDESSMGSPTASPTAASPAHRNN